MTSTPSLWKTSSKAALNFESRSLSRKREELTLLHLPGQIPRRLHHSDDAQAVRAAGEVHATAADLDEKEYVEPGQPDRVDHEEVGRQDLVSVLAHELAPGALAAARSQRQAMAAEHAAHDQVGAAVAQLAELALDLAIPPPRVLARQLHGQIVKVAPGHGSLSARSSCVRRPLSAHQVPMPAQQRLGAGQE